MAILMFQALVHKDKARQFDTGKYNESWERAVREGTQHTKSSCISAK